MVGHRCNCPLCQEVEDLSSPAGKRSEASAATAFIADKLMTVTDYPQLIAAPAADTQTVDSFNPNLRVPGSPPPLGLVASENLRTAIETVDDTADAPAPASKENAAASTATGKRTRMRKKAAHNA